MASSKNLNYAALASLFLAGCPAIATATTFEVIHYFEGGRGNFPLGNLAVDAQGRIYGATYRGPPNGSGKVYRLVPPKSGYGEWTRQILFSFDKTDGRRLRTGVVLDAAGNVYGTTSAVFRRDGGTVFKLDAANNFALVTLHRFFAGRKGSPDGYNPFSPLTVGPDGYIYGVTQFGGQDDHGTVYRVSLSSGIYEQIAAFPGVELNPRYPSEGALIIDQSGSLVMETTDYRYGEPFAYRPRGGHVIRLKNEDGVWKKKTLFVFPPAVDLAPALEGIIADGKGSYAGCAQAYENSRGNVFRLDQPKDGGLPLEAKIVDDFTPQGSTGPWAKPDCWLTRGKGDRIAGVTTYGGLGYGVFFQLHRDGKGWTQKITHTFNRISGLLYPSGTPLKIGDWYYGTAEGSTSGSGGIYRLKD